MGRTSLLTCHKSSNDVAHKSERTLSLVQITLFFFYSFLYAFCKPLFFWKNHSSQNYHDFFYITNESPNSHMPFEKKIRPNSTELLKLCLHLFFCSLLSVVWEKPYHSITKKMVWITLIFFTDFYIPNESPDSCMHFAKKISPNWAELPKLWLHQVSEASVGKTLSFPSQKLFWVSITGSSYNKMIAD